MKIVIDATIPFTKGLFEPYAEVVYKDGHTILHEDILDADALIIRTRTECSAAFLEGSRVKIISTATRGTDNIDLDYCKEHGIFVQNAAGCTSGSVMNYVFSALYGTASRKSIDLSGATFGIIGVGSSGSAVESMARLLGFKVLLCDPPRAEKEGKQQFCSLDYLLENSDVISLHMPLNESTRGIADKSFFRKMKVGAFFINASNGELVCEEDLIEAIPKLGPVIIDAWRNEPDINRALMDMADIATPHIAGYSYQGKQNATAAAVRATARFFDIKPLFDFFPETDIKELESAKLNLAGLNQGQITSLFQYNYPIFTDDFIFRMSPEGFERLREEYMYRREFFAA